MCCASGTLLGGEDEINYLAVIIQLLDRSCPYGLIVLSLGKFKEVIGKG